MYKNTNKCLQYKQYMLYYLHEVIFCGKDICCNRFKIFLRIGRMQKKKSRSTHNKFGGGR